MNYMLDMSSIMLYICRVINSQSYEQFTSCKESTDYKLTC